MPTHNAELAILVEVLRGLVAAVLPRAESVAMFRDCRGEVVGPRGPERGATTESRGEELRPYREVVGVHGIDRRKRQADDAKSDEEKCTHVSVSIAVAGRKCGVKEESKRTENPPA